MRLEVLICTHDRRELLERTLASLERAPRPEGVEVGVLVMANACSDDTAQFLRHYERAGRLPLRWREVPTPGKSHALNAAAGLLEGDYVAMVDDDHRVDGQYLCAIAEATRRHPEASMLCGRILPDWRGEEPAWVHDEGPYRIYPLPVPRFDPGEESRELDRRGPIPGGGNLVLARGVFGRVGQFRTELGPCGHDLGGAEDIDFVLRALAAGERLRYVPGMVQHHYVDPERLRFGYLVRKSYERSQSSTRVRAGQARTVPLYLWRKLATYALCALLSLSRARVRFYAMRIAATLGEMSAYRLLRRAPLESPGPR